MAQQTILLGTVANDGTGTPVRNAGQMINENFAELYSGPSTPTGTVIDFATNKVYNTSAAPATTNITNDLANAKQGVVQKLYHNHSVAPTVPAGWVKVGSGVYTVSVLNIIYAEWCGGTRVEYWIVQQS